MILLDIKEVYTAINSDQRVRQLVKTAPLNIIERMQVKHFDSKQFILHQGEQYQWEAGRVGCLRRGDVSRRAGSDYQPAIQCLNY